MVIGRTGSRGAITQVVIMNQSALSDGVISPAAQQLLYTDTSVPGTQSGVPTLPLSVASGPAGGDLDGYYPNPGVAAIDGVSISGTPSAGQVLTATSSSAASWAAPGASSYMGNAVFFVPSGGDSTFPVFQDIGLLSTYVSGIPSGTICCDFSHERFGIFTPTGNINFGASLVFLEGEYFSDRRRWS